MLQTRYETSELSDICQFCRTRLISDPETGERVCSSCGIVSSYENVATQSSQTPSMFGENDSKSHYTMMYDMNLPSVIGYENFDARGNPIHENFGITRIRQLDNALLSRDSKRRSLSKAIDTITRLADLLSLNDSVADRAYQIYRHANGNGIGRRRSIVGLAMASVYVACKELGIARSSSEIENAMRDINPRGIRRYCRALARELNMNVTTPDPSSYVSRIVAAAKLNGRVERMALKILSEVKNNSTICSRKPVPLAAAAIFLAARLNSEPVTQLRIACASEVTPITIRKRSLELLEALKGSQSAAPLQSSLEKLQDPSLIVGPSNKSSGDCI